MIIIKFNDNVEHKYNSFDEILNLDNYNEIIYLNCSFNKLTSLPELPESLTDLNCSNNNLTNLPKLPELLKYLYCYSNNLHCYSNNLHCYSNQLPSQLKRLPQETMKEYIKKCNEYYYDYNAIIITNFFKNVVLAQKRAVQILLAKSVENFYYSPDCKVMMKIREKQWQKQWKKHFK